MRTYYIYIRNRGNCSIQRSSQGHENVQNHNSCDELQIALYVRPLNDLDFGLVAKAINLVANLTYLTTYACFTNPLLYFCFYFSNKLSKRYSHKISLARCGYYHKTTEIITGRHKRLWLRFIKTLCTHITSKRSRKEHLDNLKMQSRLL